METDNHVFARVIIFMSLLGVLLLVAGVLFGPWQVDPQASVLIALVAQPGGVAMGWLFSRKGD